MFLPGLRRFSVLRPILAEFSHVVVGGGCVGLLVAALLSQRPGSLVLLVEKNHLLGQETSSRNLEVVHAGLYYPEALLKTRLCIEGKELLYSEARTAGVEMQQCGKWIVAQLESELAYLHEMHTKAQRLGVPTEWVSLATARELEPAIRASHGVLALPTTGILLAHSLMDYYELVLQENDGMVATATEVVLVSHSGDYTLGVATADGLLDITAEVVVNCAGLHAPAVSNMLLPPERHVTAYYAKGNYFSPSSPLPRVLRLVYPCPTKNVALLGTHLTIDLGGQMRFGPDLEWVDAVDYTVSSGNVDKATSAVERYLPAVADMLEPLVPSMAGIRPKIHGKEHGEFQDFVIREEDGFPGWINCLAIESPGLTASMAIGRYVCGLL